MHVSHAKRATLYVTHANQKLTDVVLPRPLGPLTILLITR